MCNLSTKLDFFNILVLHSDVEQKLVLRLIYSSCNLEIITNVIEKNFININIDLHGIAALCIACIKSDVAFVNYLVS